MSLRRIVLAPVRFINNLGWRKECPLCGWTGFTFLPVGESRHNRRFGGCPKCGSRERHRLAFHLLGPMFKPDQVTLHVAPEPIMEKWLRSLSADYLSIDIEKRAMQQMDLTNLTLPDNSKGLVFCSHVLEHVPDDRKAMAEMFRVLRPGGMAVIMVPIGGAVTDEDPSVVTPEQRVERFHQKDHVRLYGIDIVERLKDAGFEVRVLTPYNCEEIDVQKMGLKSEFYKELFLCRKPG